MQRKWSRHDSNHWILHRLATFNEIDQCLINWSPTYLRQPVIISPVIQYMMEELQAVVSEVGRCQLSKSWLDTSYSQGGEFCINSTVAITRISITWPLIKTLLWPVGVISYCHTREKGAVAELTHRTCTLMWIFRHVRCQVWSLSFISRFFLPLVLTAFLYSCYRWGRQMWLPQQMAVTPSDSLTVTSQQIPNIAVWHLFGACPESLKWSKAKPIHSAVTTQPNQSTYIGSAQNSS